MAFFTVIGVALCLSGRLLVRELPPVPEPLLALPPQVLLAPWGLGLAQRVQALGLQVLPLAQLPLVRLGLVPPVRVRQGPPVLQRALPPGQQARLPARFPLLVRSGPSLALPPRF